MVAALRFLTVAGLIAVAAPAAFAQRTSTSPSAAPAPPRPQVPGAPAVPGVDQDNPVPPGVSPAYWQHFGHQMGQLGDSLGRTLGALGDSLGRLGSELGEVEQRAGDHPSDHDRAQIDSIKSAMNQVAHAMATNGRVSGHSWRDVARRARDAARDASREAARSPAGQLIDRARHDPEAIPLPSADSFTVGALSIPPGVQHAGTAAAVNGNLDVFGTVAGNAIAVAGNVEVHPGGHVAGSAFSAGGQVHVDSGGVVDGEVRSLVGDFGPVALAGGHPIAATTSPRWHAARLTIAVFALLLVLGIGVLTFAEEQLNNVTATLANRFGRSAWYGVVGEIALAPGLLAVTVGLAITVVGVVLLPFAIVGYGAVAIGAAILGFVAVAEATGTTILRAQSQASLTPRGAQLRAVVAGIGSYGGLWLLTSLVGTDSGVGIALRGIAVVVTAVAMTVGFGSVILWRFEIRRSRRLAAVEKSPVDDSVWQTPTPITGVAAARRPTPAASSTGEPT